MAQVSTVGQVPEQRRDRKIFVWIAFVGAAIALLVLASQAINALDTFSESWNLGLHEELNDFKI